MSLISAAVILKMERARPGKESIRGLLRKEARTLGVGFGELQEAGKCFSEVPFE